MVFNILLETSDTMAVMELLRGSFMWVESLRSLDK